MADNNVEKGNDVTVPLGSVVYLRQGAVKMLIIGRFNLVEQPGETKPMLFEYAAVPCPVGFSGGKEVYYFNSEDIDRIVFSGFENNDDEQLLRAVEEWKKDNSTKFEAGKIGRKNT